MSKNIWKKSTAAVLLAAALAVSLTACQEAGEKADRKDASEIAAENQGENKEKTIEEKSKEEGTETSGKRTEYPLTITTYGSDGKELLTTYEKAPKKVAAVYQGSIETMLELGLEDHIVAAAGLDNEVPDELKDAFSKINYLDEFSPSLETVTMLEPDMIFSWGSYFGEKTLGDAAGWVENKTNIYMNSNTRPKEGEAAYRRTLENEYQDILNIGKIFDVQGKAESLVKEMKDTISLVKTQTAAVKKSPRALIVESADDVFTNYNAASLGGDMVTQLGGTLVYPDEAVLGKEDMISANPDVIFVVYMPYAGENAQQVKQESLGRILKDETYASLDAVKNGRVIPIMLSEMYASATRTQDGIQTFAKGLYPEVTFE